MDGSRISAVGSALADANRAAMLCALQSGRAHSAGELARWCGVAPSTASKHLAKLVDTGLVVIEPAGRHRYYRIASVEIADLLETIDTIMAEGWIDADGDHLQITSIGVTQLARLGLDVGHLREGRRPLVRACLDWTERQQHLAGAVGAALLDHMLRRRWLRRARDSRVLRLTEAGRASLCDHFGVGIA